MTSSRFASPAPTQCELGVPGATLAGFTLIALVHAAVLVTRLPGPPIYWLTVQGIVAGQFLFAGFVSAGLAALWNRSTATRRSWLLAIFLVLTSVALRYLLEEDAQGVAGRLSPLLSEHLTFWLMGTAGALGLTMPVALGKLLRRYRLRWLGVGLSVAMATAHALIFPHAYPGAHALVALAAALLASSSLIGISPIWRRRRLPPSVARTLLASGATLSFLSFLVAPSNAVLIELAQQPAAVFAPFLSHIEVTTTAAARIPPDQREWFIDRSQLPPVAPTQPPLSFEPGWVILLGVDSMRADLLQDEKHRKSLPELFRLRDESVWFTQARSPGSSTAPSLAATFASVHYSQLYWTTHRQRRPEVFPHGDPTPRFPEILSQAGATTLTVDTAGWLLNDFGIVRGFSVEKSARKKRYPSARETAKQLFPMLAEHKAVAQLFAFVHFLDAHAPYTSAGPAASPFEGYVKELGLVDRELGRLREFLKKEKLDDRTALIVFADHGEAFGEHGLTWHASHLYESMIRVPLLIYAPGVPPRRIDAPVSLVDVGPTILDLFRLPTPPHAMGQSLVPFMQGREVRLTRPIIAEARLKRALMTSEGTKIIHDTRNGTVELFELDSDPGEEHNRYSKNDARSREMLGTLSAFFEQHTHRQPGYQVPYRKW